MTITYDEKEKIFTQVELPQEAYDNITNPPISVFIDSQTNPNLVGPIDTIVTPPPTDFEAGSKILSQGKFQSPNFSTQLSGWSIDSEGNAEFNNGTFRGTFIIGGALITTSDITQFQNDINAVSSLGGGTVYLVPGTYSANSSFTIPSNVTLNGNGSIIDFEGGAFQILIQGSGAYSTGTLAVNFGGTSVTGSGTTWTAAMVGQSILIGDYWYTISARSSNTAITLASRYLGLNISGASYVIATTINGVGIINITLNNSSTTLLSFRYVNGLVMDGLVTSNGNRGINGQDSATVNYLNSNVNNCVTGIVYNNVPFCTISNSNIYTISGGAGMDLTQVTNTSINAFSIQDVTGVGIKFTNCSNLGMENYSIIECTSNGVEYVSGNSDDAILNGYINSCGGDGIKLTASSNRIEISTTNFLNNTGYGINIANSNCNGNFISTNAFSNNGLGSINDLGTGTNIYPSFNTFSGDGSDGVATFDGSSTPTGSTKSGNNYTLTRDVYYINMTISTGCTVDPAGYRIFGTGILTLNGTAKIFRDGNAGGAGTNASGSTPSPGGSAGAALVDGYLKGSVAGQIGGTGQAISSTPGVAGTSVSNSIGSNGANGGNPSGGVGGTASVANVKIISPWSIMFFLDVTSTGATLKYSNSAGSGSGGGGGSGSGGGIIGIYFREIIIGASASITVNGGNGGKGGDAQGSGASVPGGGGGGGGGGQIILVYTSIINNGSLSVSGGTGGLAGSGSGATVGASGSSGNVRQFKIVN